LYFSIKLKANNKIIVNLKWKPLYSFNNTALQQGKKIFGM